MYTQKTIQCLRDHQKLTYSLYQVAKRYCRRTYHSNFNIQQYSLHHNSVFKLTFTQADLPRRWHSIQQVYFTLEKFLHTTCTKYEPHEDLDAVVSEETNIIEDSTEFKDSDQKLNVAFEEEDLIFSNKYEINDNKSTQSENLLNAGIDEWLSEDTERPTRVNDSVLDKKSSEFLANNLTKFEKKKLRSHQEKDLEMVQRKKLADEKPLSNDDYLWSSVRPKLVSKNTKYGGSAFSRKKWLDNYAERHSDNSELNDFEKDSSFLANNTTKFKRNKTRSYKNYQERVHRHNHVLKLADEKGFRTNEYYDSTDLSETVAMETKLVMSSFPVGTEHFDSRASRVFREEGVGNELVPSRNEMQAHGDISGHEQISDRVQMPLKVPIPKLQQLAPLVNDSELLKSLVHVGVDLSKLERRNMAGKVLKLDFNRDVKPVIFFLHDIGVERDKIGHVLSVFPQIMLMDFDNVKARIRYLRSKKFNREAISRIVVGNPKFLQMETVELDSVLGFIQKKLFLTGDELRQMVTTFSKILTYDPNMIQAKIYLFQDGFGFTEREMKAIFLRSVSLLKSKDYLIAMTFNYLREEMSITHKQLVEWPMVLQRGKNFLDSRHKFLLKQGRAQYNPELPNYVSLKALVDTKDEEFSIEVAKASLAEYNRFLRTM